MMMMMIHRYHHPPQKQLFLLPPSLTVSSSSTTTAAAVLSTSGVSKSFKKKGRTPGDLDIVQLLLQHQVRSQAAAGELRQLVTQAAGPTNNKSAWGSFLHSNLPQVHDRVWPVYLKMEMKNYIWALNESDNIHERQQCQQQQPVPQVQNPPPVHLPQSHQLQVPHQPQPPPQQQQQQQQQQQHHQHQQQYQFTTTPQYATQVLPVAGPSQVSGTIGAGGISGVSSLLDAGQIDQSTPRASLGDVSFTSLLQGATDSLSPSDYLNMPSIDDSDNQP